MFLCSLEKFPESPLFPEMFFNCSLERNDKLLPKIHFNKKFAHVPIIKNGKFPSSHNPWKTPHRYRTVGQLVIM